MEALGIEVRLGTTAEALEQTGDAVTVRLSDGTEERARLVIGADGLRSQVRRLIGIELEPRYTGFGVWRAVHHRPLDLVDKIMQMGHGKRLGIMPISQSHLYTFGTIPEPGEAWYAPEDWPGLMQSKFSEFGGPVGPLLAELSEESDVIYTAVEEVILPLPWHRGNVVLIGDAAHASTPFMGQGGAMAMQDAVVLAGLFATRSVPDALEAFGAMRAPVCRFVQDVSRKVGEAGAAEDAAGLSGRRERMQQNAQADVDHFYTELGRLSAVALAEHDLAT
jgi:2-polyprenyl-6-methoxyphenol hydroxylase-like FAD-dependent oxidoreductase